MIVYLEGTLREANSDYLTLVTNGVGYQVFAAKPTLLGLPDFGSRLQLQIHTVVREDSFQLYGFNSDAERQLFIRLTQVSNVGPKLALTILSGLSAAQLVEAIGKEDLVRLTAISGIGKKTAERLILELKDKLVQLYPLFSMQQGAMPTKLHSEFDEDVLSAFMNLGYTRQEAERALKSIPEAQSKSLTTLLKEGLKALA